MFSSIQRDQCRGQMAVEMVVLLPVYLMLVFAVFTLGDFVLIKARTDQSSWYLTRTGQSMTKAQAKTHIDPFWSGVASGSLEVRKSPAYSSGTTSIQDITSAVFLGEAALSGASGQCDYDIGGFDPSYLIPHERFMSKGLRRSSRNTEVAYHYDRRTYPGYGLFPKPTMQSVMVATFGEGDPDRERGSWNSHKIENSLLRFQSVRVTSGLHTHVRFLIDSAWYARHLGWYGYNWKNQRTLYPGVAPFGDTSAWCPFASIRGMYHPIQYTKKNLLHFNFYTRLPF